MDLRVLKAHRSAFPDPVRFGEGDILAAGRRDPEFPEWVWVRDPVGREGWAPACILEMDGHGAATALEAYCARELDTEQGECLSILRLLGGWALVENARGGTGWVPWSSVEPDMSSGGGGA